MCKSEHVAPLLSRSMAPITLSQSSPYSQGLTVALRLPALGLLPLLLSPSLPSLASLFSLLFSHKLGTPASSPVRMLFRLPGALPRISVGLLPLPFWSLPASPSQ